MFCLDCCAYKFNAILVKTKRCLFSVSKVNFSRRNPKPFFNSWVGNMWATWGRSPIAFDNMGTGKELGIIIVLKKHKSKTNPKLTAFGGCFGGCFGGLAGY
jgi:hypothetical protein